MWSEAAQKGSSDEDSKEDSDEDSDESSDDNSTGPSSQEPKSRSDRKAEKKARKDAAAAKKLGTDIQVGDMPSSSEDEDDSEDGMPANPNHSKASRSQAARAAQPAADDSDVDEAADGVKNMSVANRKERESANAALANEKYRKLHEQGKTDEAKSDLARLSLIREQREADAARRQVCCVPSSRSQVGWY